MDPNDASKTTLTIGDAVYYYDQMSFGLKNARATFQRLMNDAFTH